MIEVVKKFHIEIRVFMTGLIGLTSPEEIKL